MDEIKKNSVLVIDDENSNILALTQFLSPEYTVYAVKSGQDGIKAAEKYLPDIIMLDIIMPDMDGYEVIAALKGSEKTMAIPVIFITGLSSAGDEEKGLALGVADYITKPFSPAAVKLRVKNQMTLLMQKRQMEETLKHREIMLGAMNSAVSVLLKAEDNGSFEDSLLVGMEIIGRSVDADCVEVWQNEMIDGELRAVLKHFWFSEMGRSIKSDYPVSGFSYKAVPQWEKHLSQGGYIQGPVSGLSKEEQDFLSVFKIKTVLIIPTFIQNQFWGFCCIDDCRNTRNFTEDEVNILRSGSFMLANAINRNVTQKAMIDEMRNAEIAEESNKAKSLFLANMSHEMRTPMNVVVGLTDLMLEDDIPAENFKENLKKISIAGNTLLGLINDVLDISKIEAGKLELAPVKYEVPSLLNDIINLNVIRIEEKPITFLLDIKEDLLYRLYGDDLRVKQIINNILSNAFKYTQKGTVILGMSCEQDGDDVWVSFFVSDTGIGIRKEDLNKLFTNYGQVNTQANRMIEGTGLGLSITKQLAVMMDGEITAESEYGKGSVFRVRIRQGFIDDTPIGPVVSENLRNFRYTEDKRIVNKKLVRPDLSYARVLVVDDMQTNLDVAAGLLGRYKMQVDCVLSGQEAIDRINGGGSPGETQYTAIFMDHMMPGMDGIETLAAIRGLDTEYAKKIPVIALTANAVQGMENIFYDNGFQDFLSKPINTMTLDSVIHRWIVDKTRS